MATTRDTLKKWFRRGAYPTASQFAAWIDSFFHKDDKIPVTSVEGLTDTLNTKADVVIVDSIKKQQEKDSSRLDDMVTKDSIISGGYRPVHVIDLGTYENGKFSLNGTSYWGDMQMTLYSYLDGSCGVLLQSRTQFNEPRVFAPTRIYRSGDTLFVIEFMVSATQLCEIRIDEDADVEGGESLFTQRLIETGPDGYWPVHVIDLGTYENGKFSLDGTSYWGDMQMTLYSYLDGSCGVLLQSRTQFNEPRMFAPTRIYRSGDTLFVIEFMVSATQLCEIRIDEDADVEGGESLFTQRLIEIGSGDSGGSGSVTTESYSDIYDYNEVK